MFNTTFRRLAAVVFAIALTSLAAVPAAVADHGEGHNGETLELSKSEDIVDGEVVTVTLTSWLPGKTATIVTCFNYPAAGPADCELSNYGQHIVTIADDGTGTYDYPVAVVPGRCDESNSCFIVAGDGFGANANYAAQTITFAAASAAEPAEEEPEPAPEPTPAPAEEEPGATATSDAGVPPVDDSAEVMEEEPEVVEEAPEPEPAEAEPAEAEPAEAEPAEAEPEAADVITAPADDGDDGNSVWVWLLPVIIVVVVLALAALWFLRRRAAA